MVVVLGVGGGAGRRRVAARALVIVLGGGAVRRRVRVLGALVPAEDGEREGALLQGGLLPQQVVHEEGRGEHAGAAGMLHQQVRLHPYDHHVSLRCQRRRCTPRARGGRRARWAAPPTPRLPTPLATPQKKLSSTLRLYVLIYSNLSLAACFEQGGRQKLFYVCEREKAKDARYLFYGQAGVASDLHVAAFGLCFLVLCHAVDCAQRLRPDLGTLRRSSCGVHCSCFARGEDALWVGTERLFNCSLYRCDILGALCLYSQIKKNSEEFWQNFTCQVV